MSPKLPIFVMQIRPICVPSELEQLPKDAQVRYEYKGVYVSGTGVTQAIKVIETIQSTIKRQGKGFFTLDEAAHVLAEHLGNVSPKTMLDSLLDAGRKSSLVVRHVDTQLPIDPSSSQIFPYANVKIQDINTWLETQGVTYRFPNDATTKLAPCPMPPAPVGSSVWIAQAQARAQAIIKESREKDLYPSQKNLGDQIAREFRKACIMGADGKPLSGATIKRHALKGISSATAKQLSTTIGRGK